MIDKRTGILMYQTEDGDTRIDVRLEDETIWLTQTLMAELFHTTTQNITMHVKAIYDEGELIEKATCKDYLQVRDEGPRRVKRKIMGVILAAVFRLCPVPLKRLVMFGLI